MGNRQLNMVQADFINTHKFAASDETCPHCFCSREFIEDRGLTCKQAVKELQNRNARRPHILSDGEKLSPRRAPEITRLCRTENT